MKQTLVIVIHPNLKESVINKRWIAELQKHPEQYHVHDLYGTYPDEKIAVEKEQQLIEAYDKMIFQFPFYWFSSPPLLKKWFDEVLAYGWAYGSKSGYRVGGKKVALAITAGIDERGYTAAGAYRYTLKELTTPFELTFTYIRADYRFFYAYYGIELNTSSEWIEKSIPGYINFIESL